MEHLPFCVPPPLPSPASVFLLDYIAAEGREEGKGGERVALPITALVNEAKT